MMDGAQLHAFVTVAELGSFSRAADRLFLTQPAVSKRVGVLEQALGVKLFDRVGHQILLTEAGRALLPRARRILDTMAESMQAVTSLSGQVTGTLRMGTSHHIGLHRLPPVLRTYAATYPEVELDLHFLGSEAACAAVERGELELAVVTLPQAPPARLTVQPLWQDRLYPVVAANHPLSGAQAVEAPALARWPALLPAPGTVTRETVAAAFEAQGATLTVRLSTNYLETLKMLAAVGLGWSVLPHTMLDDDLAVLKVKHIACSRLLGVVHHRERTLSNAGRALIEVLTTQADVTDAMIAAP